MKILFVENRYKTGLWEVIAKEYQKLGHEIYWIVQNPMFKPSFGNISILPFPKKINFKKVYSSEIQKVIDSNRGLNYFGVKTDDFIFWYEKEVEKIIEAISPDLVFGEPTLFHELLVINSCKKRNILFLHPSSTRYPSNRFSFYLYDTLTPFIGSNDQMKNEVAIKTVNAIAKRESLPDYFKVLKYNLSNIDWLKDKLRLSFGYLLGEKYNTPSPIHKFRINKYYQNNIREWEKIASSVDAVKPGFNVLYAMQMQPEANIDVWGNPNSNQTNVISMILESLNKGEKLIIKPNPKSKYEISQQLLSVIKLNRDKVIPLTHSSKMDVLWDKIDLVITVTGTISMECIFDNKPLIMLGPGLQNNKSNCYVLKPEESMRPIFDQIKDKKFPVLSQNEKVNYLQELIQTSYEGTNGDGLHNLHYINDNENLDNLKDAYIDILNYV